MLTLPASGLEGAEPAFPLSRAEVSQEGAGMHWTVCLGGKREKGIELRGQRELSERDRPHETSSLLSPLHCFILIIFTFFRIERQWLHCFKGLL